MTNSELQQTIMATDDMIIRAANGSDRKVRLEQHLAVLLDIQNARAAGTGKNCDQGRERSLAEKVGKLESLLQRACDLSMRDADNGRYYSDGNVEIQSVADDVNAYFFGD